MRAPLNNMEHNIHYEITKSGLVTRLLEIQPVTEHQQRAHTPKPIADRQRVKIRQHVRQIGIIQVKNGPFSAGEYT